MSMNETTRLDGPGIAGVATVFLNPTTALAHVTPDTPTPPKPTPETGEATDVQLRECYHTAKGTWTDCLRAVYNLGRTRGEDRVCARFPRLWGMWCEGRWGPVFATERTSGPHSDRIREFDPRTGGPKA